MKIYRNCFWFSSNIGTPTADDCCLYTLSRMYEWRAIVNCFCFKMAYIVIIVWLYTFWGYMQCMKCGYSYRCLWCLSVTWLKSATCAVYAGVIQCSLCPLVVCRKLPTARSLRSQLTRVAHVLGTDVFWLLGHAVLYIHGIWAVYCGVCWQTIIDYLVLREQSGDPFCTLYVSGAH